MRSVPSADTWAGGSAVLKISAVDYWASARLSYSASLEVGPELHSVFVPCWDA